MGYACPVCSAPQADGEHLANHLAFSAILGHEDHETWLDEHAPDWGKDDPEALAERIRPLAESVRYEDVFEDTTGTEPAGVGLSMDQPEPAPRQADADFDEAVQTILQTARKFTENGWNLEEDAASNGAEDSSAESE